MSGPDFGPDLVYLNGEIVPSREAVIPAFDYGFLYGFGLFETMRSYKGTIFRLDEHIGRLLDGAAKLGFGSCLSHCEMGRACDSTVQANGFKDARVRLSVTPGNGDGMPDPSSCNKPTVMVTARRLTPLPSSTYARGFTASLSSSRRCSISLYHNLKSLSYMECLMARFEARNKGFDEALLLNQNGDVAEASSSNVFIVSEGVLSTPSLEGILPGISRADVLSVSKRLGIPVQERALPLDELYSSDEAFLTNSIMEVMPLTVVEGTPIGQGKPGPVTLRIAAEYRALADMTCGTSLS